MYKREVIVVRYLNNNMDYPYSRPHKVQKITDEDKVKYFTMNESSEINPETFTTTWPKKLFASNRATTSQKAEWELTRIRFQKKTKDGYTRPKRVYKITLNGVVEYAPLKGTSKRYNPTEFIVDWERGPRPTPKPSRKYSKEQLKEFGYSDELIKKIHRGFSSKDIDSIAKKLGKSRKESCELLEKYGCVSKVMKEKEALYEEVKRIRKEAREDVEHMGRFTHKKVQISAKIGSRRYRKMLAKGQIDKKGLRIIGKPKNEKLKRSKKR